MTNDTGSVVTARSGLSITPGVLDRLCSATGSPPAAAATLVSSRARPAEKNFGPAKAPLDRPRSFRDDLRRHHSQVLSGKSLCGLIYRPTAYMFQFYAEDYERFTGDRDVETVRQLNPELESSATWLEKHRDELKATTAGRHRSWQPNPESLGSAAAGTVLVPPAREWIRPA